MKKFHTRFLLFFICLTFILNVKSQKLEIGQSVPDITITNIRNYKTTTAKLSDFKGKLLILDFWATWCAPCVNMIPKLDSMQKHFEGKVRFLTVTYQKVNEVEIFMTKLQKQTNKVYNLSQVFEDKILSKYFPHSILPHYVWIDGEGVIKAITESEEVNEHNIEIFLQEGKLDAKVKKDTTIAFNLKTPLLINNNGGDGSNLLYHSVLTSYTHGLGCGLMIKRDSTGMRILARNLAIIELYRLSFRDKGRYLSIRNAIMEVKDTSRLIKWTHGMEYLEWLNNGNGYCYELIVPPNLMAQGYEIMQQDLDRLFPQYSASVEKLKSKCLVLVRTSDKTKFMTSGEKAVLEFDPFGCRLINVPLSLFTNRLKMMYMQGKFPDIIDETGYKGKVDLIINASLSNLVAINNELRKYDLELVEKELLAETLVIKDRDINDKQLRQKNK